MLKKLFKHEFIGLYRILVPLYAVLFGFAGVLRLLQIFDSTNPVVSTIMGIIITLTVIIAIGLMFAGFVLIIINFYKSMLSKQGYLTFSLPFEARSHIICKLVCAVVASITSIIAELIALLIIFLDYNFISSFFDVFKMMLETGKDYFGITKVVILCLELGILAVTTLCANYLMFFAAMAIGQQFGNRIIGAVVSYFCLYAAVEIIMFALMAIFSPFLNDIFVLDFNQNAFLGYQKFFGIMFVISAVQAVGYFLITNHFLSKKLNLE